MKKLFLFLMCSICFITTIKGDLLGKIQSIDALIQQGKYNTAENYAKKLLSDSSITAQERASIQNLLSEIERKKASRTNDIIENIISSEGTENTEEVADETEEENLLVTKEDVSDGSKFEAYDNYERAALATKNSDTIFKMAQLYFRDGLYERAVNVSKKDSRGDIKNLYIVAIGSRLLGQYDQSIEYYNKILSRNGNQLEAKLGRGISYKSKGDFQRALDDLRSYASVNSNSEVNRTINEINNILANK